MKKLEVGTLKHAFRSEMSQVVHWTLVGAVAVVVGLQMLQAGAYDVAPVNQIYTYFF